MTLFRLARAAFACALALLLMAPRVPALAQDFPSRNVHIVVPLAAGSGMDVVVRIYAEELSKSLGKPVVVENQPGAALMLAAQNVARAAPDGHTLVVASSPVMAVNPTLYKKVNYDAEKDFVPLALYAQSPFVLITNPAFGAETAKDFIKKAQDAANPITYATTGAGTLQFLTMETLKRDHNFKAAHVPYRSPPQIVDRHRRRPRRLVHLRNRRGAHADSGRQAQGARHHRLHPSSAVAASADHGRSPRSAWFRGGLLARADGAVRHPAPDRGAPARCHDENHRERPLSRSASAMSA